MGAVGPADRGDGAAVREVSTAARPLLRWLYQPRDDRGINFAEARDWCRWSYLDLARHCHRTARGLVRAGAGEGQRVAVVLRTGPDFVAALFGAMAAGATPCPIAPPAAFGDARLYAEHLTGLLAEARPALVLTEPELLSTVRALAGGLPVYPVEYLANLAGPAGGLVHPVVRRSAELALVQFTSGSSGRARGVGVPYEALEHNLDTIRRWLGYTPDDPGASWLPVHHDMGLIGCLLTPIWCRADLWLLRPEQFVQQPERYLRCFGEHGATITAMPGFGLDHIVRRVPPEAVAGWDLSAWKALIVGAERVRPDTAEAFTRLLAPAGFRREALLPAYGMAEATLVASGLPPGQGWSTVTVGNSALDIGSRVRFDPDGHRLVGCGPPVPGTALAVLDEQGRALPEGWVGEILIQGPGVVRGYLRERDSPSLTSIDGGQVRTGDIGFLHGGQLYVIGRLGDSVKVRGRTLFAEDIEAALVAGGLPARQVAAALGMHEGRPTVVAVVERSGAVARVEGAADVEGALRRAAQGATTHLLQVRRGRIPRTSSGKPKRRALWREFTCGALDESPARPLS